MPENYSVRAILSAQDQGFRSVFENAGKMTTSLADKLKSGLGFGVLAGAGQKAFDLITSGITGVVGELNASSAAWKTFDGNMAMLGKGAGEIAEVKNELQDFATKTIYSASDMATTYSQLVAVGIKSADKLVKGFGGLAAAAENPTQAMKTLSQQATQMAAKPKVAWEDFKLMLEQTPAGIAAVAKEMGMSTSDLVKSVQSGTIATEDFFDAVSRVGTNDAFTKLATEYKTAGQAMDGLKETLSVKLTPAFDALSQMAINGISGIIDKIDQVDPSSITDKVMEVVETVTPYWEAIQDGAGKIGKAFMNAASSLGSAFGALASNQSTIDAFAGTVDLAANIIAGFFNIIAENADLIAALAPGLLAAAVAFKAYKILSSIAPAAQLFAKGLGGIAKSVSGSLASKLFGTAAGQAAVGTASTTSASQVLSAAAAFIALGAGVALIAAGFLVMANAATMLAEAGAPAIVIMVGLVAALAGLAIGAAALGPALTAGAVGFIAFGAAIALVGVGALLAATALTMVAGVLPTVVEYGASGAVSIVALGASMLVFAAGAAVAGAGALVLGAGLLVMGAGALVAAAGVLLLSAAVMALGIGLALSAVSTLTLGAGLLLVAAGGAAAGAALLLVNVGILTLTAGAAAGSLAVGALAVAMVAGTVAMTAFGLAVSAAALGSTALSGALLLILGTLALISGKTDEVGRSLNAMVASVSFVDNALSTLGATANAAMDAFIGALRNAEGKAKSAGQTIGDNIKSGAQNGLKPLPQIAQSTMSAFANAVQSGGNRAVSSANTMSASIQSALAVAGNSAYSNGYNIGAGMASGMYGALSEVRAAASALVAEADRAIRAKAMIHSPAKLTEGDGEYFGEGFVVGVEKKIKDAMAIGEKMVQRTADVITGAAPRFAYRSSGFGLHDDYNYAPTVYVNAEVTSVMDGREVGYGSARYVQEKNDFDNKRKDRIGGRV